MHFQHHTSQRGIKTFTVSVKEVMRLWLKPGLNSKRSGMLRLVFLFNSDIHARQCSQFHHCTLGELRKSSCILSSSVKGAGQNTRQLLLDYFKSHNTKGDSGSILIFRIMKKEQLMGLGLSHTTSVAKPGWKTLPEPQPKIFLPKLLPKSCNQPLPKDLGVACFFFSKDWVNILCNA